MDMDTRESAVTSPLRGTHLELWELVRAEIRKLIIIGEFAPGERLVESALAERFQVSRGPIRTALMELERVGLVVSVPRRGIQVATFDRSDIDELFDVVKALERMAAREAAERASDEQVERLGELIDELSDAQRGGDVPTVIEADLALHRELMLASGNRRLYRIWSDISEQLRFVVRVTQRAMPEIDWAPYNRPIVEAVAARDPDRAEQAVASCFDVAHEQVRGLSVEAFDLYTGRTRR
jgi:DNA-binding GntR family transcriptional regulator